jgi:hypothetical protein
MNTPLPQAERFVFRSRPSPIPGDLRINWKLANILLMLGLSRGRRASLAKLHILNGGIQYPRFQAALKSMITNNLLLSSWLVRVEPAFGRAINFALGEGLITGEEISQRAGFRLTARGQRAFEAIVKEEDALFAEKTFLANVCMPLTESLVTKLLNIGQRQ